MASTAPGIRPASMSAFSTADIRASRSLERPTSSGFARGRGSAANAALQASRPNAPARIRNDTIDASRFGLFGPLIVRLEPMATPTVRPAAASGIFAWADHALTRACLRGTEFPRIMRYKKYRERRHERIF